MSGYAKLFSTIVTSTIWNAPDHVRIVWVTMMALADRDGIVEASIPGLAVVSRVTEDPAREAIRFLSDPDPDSRTKVLEGRRIVEVPGGWKLVTYEVYRDRGSKEEAKQKAAARLARWRQMKGITSGHQKGETRGNAGKRGKSQAEAEAQADP